MCSEFQFQEFRTNLWLFDTLATSSMLNEVEIWGPWVDHHNTYSSTDGWRCMERPLVCIISRVIRAKASVLHDIIRGELATPLLVAEALTRSVSLIHNIWDLPRNRYGRLALESSRQIASQGDTSCWYDS